MHLVGRLHYYSQLLVHFEMYVGEYIERVRERESEDNSDFVCNLYFRKM